MTPHLQCLRCWTTNPLPYDGHRVTLPGGKEMTRKRFDDWKLRDRTRGAAIYANCAVCDQETRQAPVWG